MENRINSKKPFKKIKYAKTRVNNEIKILKNRVKMGSQGFEPQSGDFSCLSTPIGHHITNSLLIRLRVFLQRQLESPMLPGYTITP